MSDLPVLHTITPAAPVAWTDELRGANYLLKSGLCPTALKSPEAVLFVILAGRDLGLSPVASLRNLQIIQGKLEVSADMQLALFAKTGGRFKWLTLSAAAAALELNAPWLDAPHVSRFSMEDAQRAQLGGDNWKKYPRAMLRSRAITAGLKDIGFDATAGVYAPGEIGGEEEVQSAEALEKPGAAAPLPEAATTAQRELIAKMAKSHVWSEKERDALVMYAAMPETTLERAKEIIDNATGVLAERKAKERAAAKEAEVVQEVTA